MSGKRIFLSEAGVPAAFQIAADYLEMLKLHLCLYIGISSVFGYVMAAKAFSKEAVTCGFFVFILACGAAVLNNIQDREYDRFFLRTCKRSLPEKKVPLVNAGIMAGLLLGAGLAGLLLKSGVTAFLYGIAAAGCYNGLYTPMKKTSLSAIIPGSICGMLPPLIGWSAAGRVVSDPDILIIMAAFGLWQVPHSFIVLLRGLDLRKPGAEEKKFPCFTQVFTRSELGLQIVIWTSLYSLAVLLFLMNSLVKTPLAVAAVSVNALALPILLAGLVLGKEQKRAGFAFAAVNLSMLLFMGAGILDKAFF